MLNIRLAKDYLLHRVKANNRHGIHSPFVYKLVDTVIYDFSNQKAYRQAQSIHQKSFTDKRVVTPLPRRVIALLYRLTAYFNPATIIEIRKNGSISTRYLQSAVPDAAIYIARDNTSLKKVFQQAGRAGMILFNGDHGADEVLNLFEQSMAHVNNDTVLIISHIYHDKNIKQAWRRIKADERVKVTIDLFYIGLVFFKPGMSKQNFRVKY